MKIEIYESPPGKNSVLSKDCISENDLVMDCLNWSIYDLFSVYFGCEGVMLNICRIFGDLRLVSMGETEKQGDQTYPRRA